MRVVATKVLRRMWQLRLLRHRVRNRLQHWRIGNNSPDRPNQPEFSMLATSCLSGPMEARSARSLQSKRLSQMTLTVQAEVQGHMWVLCLRSQTMEFRPAFTLKELRMVMKRPLLLFNGIFCLLDHRHRKLLNPLKTARKLFDYYSKNNNG